MTCPFRSRAKLRRSAATILQIYFPRIKKGKAMHYIVCLRTLRIISRSLWTVSQWKRLNGKEFCKENFSIRLEMSSKTSRPWFSKHSTLQVFFPLIDPQFLPMNALFLIALNFNTQNLRGFLVYRCPNLLSWGDIINILLCTSSSGVNKFLYKILHSQNNKKHNLIQLVMIKYGSVPHGF